MSEGLVAEGSGRPRRPLPSWVLSSAAVAARTRGVNPWGMRRCRCLGHKQRGPWRGLVLTSPARRPGTGIL
jgi:hypothetical protein